LDLGIPQKSHRVRLKEEKEEKVIHSFMRRLREREQESKGGFLDREEKEAAAWHTFQGSILANPYS